MLLGVTFAAGLVAGSIVQITPTGQNPPVGIAAAFASTPHGTDTYKLLNLFADVFERVRANYVDPVPDKVLIDNALNGMLNGLDPHSAYMDPSEFRQMEIDTQGQFGGLGLQVTQKDGLIVVISPIEGTPAAKAGIKPGDLIVAIDGKSVEGMSLDTAVNRMRGPPESKIMLTIKRSGVNRPLEFTIVRQIIHIDAVHSTLFGDIGYVRISSFTEQTDSGVRNAIAMLEAESHGHVRGFILDLRDNPGGLLDQAVAVADDFLNQGEIVATHGRHSSDDERWDAKPGGDLIQGKPLVVLINAGAASASEIVAGALQDNRRAVVVGVRSFGKGSVQTIIPLDGNGAIRLTTARYYTPSGRSIQDLGITPDVLVYENNNPEDQFPPLREADLSHALHNPNTAGLPPLPPRTDLSPIVKGIPPRPSKSWPTFDPTKPATDYQLQEALKVIQAMVNRAPPLTSAN